MDKQQLHMSIQEADNISLRYGAANRILQLLQKQRHSNNENSEKRWIWELCQNAKDACNSTGKVKISINFDENAKKVLFKHNGKAFSMANIMSLINQTSSKDRGHGNERKSGKFGTGFITTHLLSEIVNISGIMESCQESNLEYSKFSIVLDRTGKEKDQVIAAMQRAVNDLEQNVSINMLEYNIDAYNTQFEYDLNEYGVQVAKDGLENLRVSAPYVLAMLLDIEEIVVENTGERFRYSKEVPCKLKNASISEIIKEENGKVKKIYVLKISEDNISILAALERAENRTKFMAFTKQQSKLFCDFPLIGTEDFPFPVIISCQDFEPTEPRDGVFLTCKNKARLDDEVEANRNIIETACELYKKLLEYAAEKRWDGIYNITKIGSYDKKDWYDEEWLEEIIKNCKNIILHMPIIHTANDSMMELLDTWDDEQVFIISDTSKKLREDIWHLLSYIMSDSIPRIEDMHEWYHSLWSGCNSFTFEALSAHLCDYGNIDSLSMHLNGYGWKEWLLEYYTLIDQNKEWQGYVDNKELRILPNQNGVFCAIGDLYFDVDILEKYKDILYELGEDAKSWLLHLGIDIRTWFQCEDYTNTDILKCIEDGLDEADKQTQEKVLLEIVFLYNSAYEKLDVQKRICDYTIQIFDLEQQMEEVGVISQDLLQQAMKHTVTSVADRISECGTIYGLADYLNISAEEAIGWLAGFIEFVVGEGYENLINKVTKPILPNQNGEFTIKEKLFLDDEMDDTLKEIVYQAGYDIKAELLMKEVYLELPESRCKTNRDIAQHIDQYVGNNRTSSDPAVRSNFKKLLVWINDNKEEAQRIFPGLYANKHYLYNDEEIASNIKQAETLTSIMNKYNISSAEKLEELIRENIDIPQDIIPVEKESITQEILLQYGIDSAEALDEAFNDTNFANRFVRTSKHDLNTYEHVKQILERSKNNILDHLRGLQEYDLSDMQEISNTIFVVKKNGTQIYVLARPSDGGEVRIYYKEEMDILDYSMDWELWVEDGKAIPQKITFGKIIKLTGLNRIPLKGM